MIEQHCPDSVHVYRLNAAKLGLEAQTGAPISLENQAALSSSLWHIPMHELEIREVVGQGGAGEVRLGIYHACRVAVKMLYSMVRLLAPAAALEHLYPTPAGLGRPSSCSAAAVRAVSPGQGLKVAYLAWQCMSFCTVACSQSRAPSTCMIPCCLGAMVCTKRHPASTHDDLWGDRHANCLLSSNQRVCVSKQC